MMDFRLPRYEQDFFYGGFNPITSRTFFEKEMSCMNRCFSLVGGTLRGNEVSAVVSKPKNIKTYDISAEVLDKIIEGIATKKPEHGGALGMDTKTGQIVRFYLDDQGARTSVEYSPDAEKITEIINSWEEEGIAFCGMIHSHPGQFCQPSEGDYRYAKRILAAMPQTLKGRFLMPILTINVKQSTARIQAFAVYGEKAGTRLAEAVFTVDGQPLPEQLPIKVKAVAPEAAVVDQSEPCCEDKQNMLDNRPRQSSAPTAMTNEATDAGENADGTYTTSAIFRRNASLLPLEALSKRTVVIIGCGGARGFCESLARSGVGRIILVDGDTVSVTNTATQGTYLDEIGLAKTEVIANSLRRINPHMQIVEYRHFLDDTVTDEMLAEVIGRDILSDSPESVLLCGCTDNFPAQDRTVKLALKWGVPYLAGQNYSEGLAGEIVFTYPGVTETCPRCMLASRYDAYENAPEPATPVTSEGAPIYVTDLLNSIKTHIAMMLLTYGTGCRIGDELDLVKDRNLVLFSNSPLSEEKLGIRAFSRVFSALDAEERRALLMGGIVWLKQKPDRPENGFPHCPYCAGAGDLRIVRNLNADTRKPFSLARLISTVQPKGICTDGGPAVSTSAMDEKGGA